MGGLSADFTFGGWANIAKIFPATWWDWSWGDGIFGGSGLHPQYRGDINILVQGIAALSTDYATRIKNFLAEYLGTPHRPVPFGGRETALADLDTWLDDLQQPPQLLLAAPAGRGKSALLVRWSQQLIQRNDLEVVFFPVSIRFRTNLTNVVFASLTARLAALHGDPVPGRPDTPSEVWRGMMTDYLARPLPDGRRLILILDGIDEAADWEPGPDLFPFSLPERTRVLLSARYRAGDIDASAWLRQLGWDHPGMAQDMELPILTREGVADVLKEMGCPLDRLRAKVDIVARLHYLSQGDPLLVRLYVDDLWARGEAAARLQPEDLHHIQPGLKGYFQRWWDDQRRLWGNQTPLKEAAVQSLLDLLACALGPLSRSDILDELALPEAGLTAWTLDEALRPLARLVIGDGREQGYAFSHPRLNAYFREQLTDKARQAVESRFLAWGERTLAALDKGELAPKQASPYLIQYYGAHLQQAHSGVDAFLALVSDGWQRAWYELEGAYAGFLNDVERAWGKAETIDQEASTADEMAPYLGAEIRCALCLASINSLASNIPSELLVVLMVNGVLTPPQALAYARQGSEERRAEALTELAPHLPEAQRGEVLAKELAAARAIGNEEDRARALAGLAPQLAELPIVKLYPLWRDTLHRLSSRKRSNLLSDIHALTPVIAVLGGEQAVAETFHAIQEVGRWWP